MCTFIFFKESIQSYNFKIDHVKIYDICMSIQIQIIESILNISSVVQHWESSIFKFILYKNLEKNKLELQIQAFTQLPVFAIY